MYLSTRLMVPKYLNHAMFWQQEDLGGIVEPLTVGNITCKIGSVPHAGTPQASKVLWPETTDATGGYRAERTCSAGAPGPRLTANSARHRGRR